MDQVHYLTSRCNLTEAGRPISVHGEKRKVAGFLCALCFDEGKM